MKGRHEHKHFHSHEHTHMHSHDHRHGHTHAGGALPAYYFLAHSMQAVPYILLLGAASFLYIALVDLTPYLHRRYGFADSLLQLGLILAGIATIWLLHMPR